MQLIWYRGAGCGKTLASTYGPCYALSDLRAESLHYTVNKEMDKVG